MIRSCMGVLALALTCLAGSALADDMVESAQYRGWKSHKPGTNVTINGDMTLAGQHMTPTMVTTLKEVRADGVTLSQAIDVNGQKQNRDLTRPAMVKKENEFLPEGFEGTAERGGTESITVADKAYECEVYTVAGKYRGADVKGKVLRSNDIPGGIAKFELEGSGPQGAVKVVSTVTAFEIK